MSPVFASLAGRLSGNFRIIPLTYPAKNAIIGHGRNHCPHHTDEDAARVYLERQLWPDGPICPKCGLVGEAYKLNGETTRKGLYKCAGCREPFTVTIGTIFEDSKIPLHEWLFAIYLMCSNKKGFPRIGYGAICGARTKAENSLAPTRRRGSCVIAFAGRLAKNQ